MTRLEELERDTVKVLTTLHASIKARMTQIEVQLNATKAQMTHQQVRTPSNAGTVVQGAGPNVQLRDWQV